MCGSVTGEPRDSSQRGATATRPAPAGWRVGTTSQHLEIDVRADPERTIVTAVRFSIGYRCTDAHPFNLRAEILRSDQPWEIVNRSTGPTGAPVFGFSDWLRADRPRLPHHRDGLGLPSDDHRNAAFVAAQAIGDLRPDGAGIAELTDGFEVGPQSASTGQVSFFPASSLSWATSCRPAR